MSDKVGQEDSQPFEKGGENDCSNGPVTKRGCTDLPCLLIFIAHWVFFLILFFASLDGSLDKLTGKRDFRGSYCAQPADLNNWSNLSGPAYSLEDFPVGFYAMNTHKVFEEAGVLPQVCSSNMKNFITTHGTIGSSEFDGYCTGISAGSFDASSFGASQATEMLQNMDDYFYEVCVKDCDSLTPSSTRKYQWKPDPDHKTRPIMDEFWTLSSASGFTALASLLELPALPASVCPYDVSLCVPLSGLTYTKVVDQCMPASLPGLTIATPAVVSDMGSALGDVGKAWAVFILVFFLSLVIGFVFMILLRFFVGVMVWTAIFIVFALFFGGGAFMYITAVTCADDTMTKDCPNDTTGGFKEKEAGTRDMYTYVAYFLFGCAALYFLTILCMCNKIRLGIAINKVAARFVSHNKGIIFVPPVQFLVALVWWIVWIFAAMYIVSKFEVDDSGFPTTAMTHAVAYGTDDTPGQCTGAGDIIGDVWKDTLYAATCTNADPKCWRCSLPRFALGWKFWYAFFSLLWNNALLVAIGQCTVAGAVGYWYFTPNSEKGSRAAIRPAIRNCFRYHLGSLAFGAFILAVVQFIKYYLYYLQKQAEAGKNKLAALIAKIAQYCIACLERCIKFLNKNAYIQIALLGKNFCKSAWAAFLLILRNFARIGALAGIGRIVNMIGVVFITVATGVVGHFLLVAINDSNDLGVEGIGIPICTFLFFVMGYIASKLFMNVFGLAVDSVLQCFIADEELHAKGGGGEYTPDELKKFMADPKAKKKCCCC